jgi:hypothetical protein
MERIIQTRYHYGKESCILWIYNQEIGDKFPGLFEAYWKVYEAWNYHGEQVDKGASNFLIDDSSHIHWRRERFGNYLYGSLLSVNFSWESLSKLNSFDRVSFIPQERLQTILSIDGMVRHIFTALDSVVCCIFLVENEVKEESNLKQIHLSRVKNLYRRKEAYRSLSELLEKSEFKYLSDYRNLITHRPFYQFKPNKYSGRYHLPNHLNQLDSITQRNDDYMHEDVASFMSKVFNLILNILEESLVELSLRYRFSIEKH